MRATCWTHFFDKAGPVKEAIAAGVRSTPGDYKDIEVEKIVKQTGRLPGGLPEESNLVA